MTPAEFHNYMQGFMPCRECGERTHIVECAKWDEGAFCSLACADIFDAKAEENELWEFCGFALLACLSAFAFSVWGFWGFGVFCVMIGCAALICAFVLFFFLYRASLKLHKLEKSEAAAKTRAAASLKLNNQVREKSEARKAWDSK